MARFLIHYLVQNALLNHAYALQMQSGLLGHREVVVACMKFFEDCLAKSIIGL